MAHAFSSSYDFLVVRLSVTMMRSFCDQDME
ncbi:hypothetical protein T4D_7952, partial [Trichinella pseudospiralis]